MKNMSRKRLIFGAIIGVGVGLGNGIVVECVQEVTPWTTVIKSQMDDCKTMVFGDHPDPIDLSIRSPKQITLWQASQ